MAQGDTAPNDGEVVWEAIDLKGEEAQVTPRPTERPHEPCGPRDVGDTSRVGSKAAPAMCGLGT